MNVEFDVKNISGLSEEVVSRRFETEGYNELPSQKKRNVFAILGHVLSEPMLLLLLGSGAIYFFLGEVSDAAMLLSFVVVVVGITFYQENKTERALQALKNLSSPRALVIRDGEQKRISGREVVREDIIILKEGDRVPADAVVLFCSNLSVDESLLTGESAAVRKSVWDGKEAVKRPGGDDLPFVFSGTLVVQGRGAAKVISIGAATEMGKIGKTLGKITEERTLLQKETGRIVRNFSIAGAILCLLIVVIYGLTRGNWIQGVLSGLTLSMAMLPEEFPVVLIIFLTLGAWRMSRHRVLTRRAAVVETLGAATVLCTDKTGTLTLNSMKLSGLFTPLEKVADKDDGFQPGVLPSSADMPPSRPVRKEFYNEVKEHSSLTGFTRGRYWELDTHQDDLPEEFHNIVEYSILASQRDPFDPIEKEIHRVGETYLRGTEHIHNNWQLVHEYVLSKQLLALSHVWESPDKQNYIIAAKGAPESIIDLCHIDAAARVALGDKITLMADKGLRVLGVAKAIFAKGELPKNQHDFDFEFIGFIGMVDPVRKIVPNSVQEAYNAGVRVIMITGDYPGTAQHIARQIGLRNPEKYITGPEMEALDFLALRERIKEANIFARVVPEQKLAIVNALKANGEVVAMTGDGVNDAPALKAAHIGVAMGERGTDVAREASAIVLLNDDFSSIVQAIRLGRRIFDNLKKAIAYIFSVHIPIAGMSFLPVVFNLPLVLLPAHIAFLELIIDPACSTVFESVPEEKDIMNRPPRNLSEPLFSRKTLIFSLLQGLSVLAVVFIVFLLALRRGMGEIEARTLSFAALTFANILLIITNLSWKQSLGHILRSRNLALWWVCSGTLAALLAVIYVPFLRGLFHFAPLSLGELAIAFFAGIASLGWFEGLKLLGRNR